MKVRVVNEPTGSGQVVIVGCFQGEAPETAQLAEPLAAAALAAAARERFEGRRNQAVSSVTGSGVTIGVRGLGERAEFDTHDLAAFEAQALADARSSGFARASLALPDHPAGGGSEAAIQVLRRAELADYRFDRTTGPAQLELEEVEVVPPPGELAAYERAQPVASVVAGAVGRACDLGNAPPNEAFPAAIADEARELAALHDMDVEVLDRAELERLGMGGLLAVGGGSEHEPRLVRLAWGEGEESISLVGKGVTFDSGGISLKPPKAMDEMKFDKCGATTVLGVAQGAAELELPFRFAVYLPLAENMPSGGAYRPGDIVRCYNGKTVEILNTDAEGRMILADALAWAAERKPDVLLDFATLTGACVVALGFHGAGLFTRDDELAGELLAAGHGSAERLWRLPLWPEFGREMAGRQADLRNSGGRWGGASTAAAFLANFVEGAGRWAHLDIAGTAWAGAEQGSEFGASGHGVALTLTWLLRRAGRL